MATVINVATGKEGNLATDADGRLMVTVVAADVAASMQALKDRVAELEAEVLRLNQLLNNKWQP